MQASRETVPIARDALLHRETEGSDTLRHQQGSQLRELIRDWGNTEEISDSILSHYLHIIETLTSQIELSFEHAAKVLISASFDLECAYRSFWIHRCQDTEDEDRFAPKEEDPNNTEISALFARRIDMVRIMTGVDEWHAFTALRKSKWIIEKAVVFIYTDPFAEPTSYPYGLDLLFYHYDHRYEGKIDLRGPSFSRDVQIDTDPHKRFKVVTVLSWHMRAASFGQVSLNEFVAGMLNMRVYSMVELKRKILHILSELTIPQKFQEIYEFSFRWFAEPDGMYMTPQNAMFLWMLLFPELPQPWPLQRHWFQYLRKMKTVKIHEDTWVQVLAFCKTVKPDLSNYNKEDNWTFLIIDFVDELNRNKLNSKLSSSLERYIESVSPCNEVENRLQSVSSDVTDEALHMLLQEHPSLLEYLIIL